MKPLIGVLLNRRLLQRGVRGKPIFERIELYSKAARQLDVDIVLFDPTGVRLDRGLVSGYVPTPEGTFRRRTLPLPSVVHKRGLFRRRRDVSVVRRMEARRVVIFNPQVNWDKFYIHQLLSEEPRLRPYLPESVLPLPENIQWFRRQLDEGAEVFVKPRKGSLGLGIARVWHSSPGTYQYQSSRVRKRTSFRGAWNLVRKRKGGMFLQRGIPLFLDEGRRVDFRVAVQKDGENRWHIAGIAAKRAGKLPFLTNLARGASVFNGRELLARNFGRDRAGAILDKIYDVATLTAQTIHARSPLMVDLGLDIGVDTLGRPYIIEVNRRDLRILFQRSGQQSAYETLYKNPIAYARYLLTHGVNG